MIEMIEIIFASIAISGSIVWLTKAFEKFNKLKTEHNQYAKEFVKNFYYNGKDSSENVPQR